MKKHFQIALFAVCLYVLFLNLDCKKNPVAPPPPNGSDTTSNNFTFQTFTFGGNAGSCVFSDVAIINATNIWAVGAVYLDSADGAPDPFPYNAAHWDGQNWNLQKIPYDYQGVAFYHPIQCVFALASNDIWFGGNGLEHWNGNQFSNDGYCQFIRFGNSMSKNWASSDHNIYIVGSGGIIDHYNGSIGRKSRLAQTSRLTTFTVQVDKYSQCVRKIIRLEKVFLLLKEIQQPILRRILPETMNYSEFGSCRISSII